MTRNKKKLRRLARQTAGRTLKTLSLPALVLAGMLAVPAAANAAGYQDVADWTGEVTLGQSDSVTVNTPWLETDRANIAATKITLDGGSLTLTDDARLINYKRKDQTDGTDGAVFIMNDGTLSLAGKAGNTSHSSLDMTSATINGGMVTITGSAGSYWNNAAYVGGYQGLTVNGGTITLKTNSELFGGGDVGAQFLGGTVTLLGDSAARNFDGDAAHIMFGGTGANTIGGTAALTVGNGTDKAWGVMTTGQAVNMTGGALTVKGKANLLLQPNVTDGASIVYDGSGTTDIGAFNLSDGTLTVEAGGTLSAPYTQINQTGGTLTVHGLLRTEQLNPTGFNYLRSGYTLSGGKLVISGDASVIDNTSGGRNGDMQVGNLTIAGGEVSIASTGNVTAWDDGARLGGFGVGNGSVTTVSGGKVTLGNYGELFAGVESWGTGPKGGLNISGNAAIVMDGTDSVLYASSSDDGSKWVPLTIADNAGITVNAGKSGYILSRDTAMTGGTLDVQGALTVAGKSKKGGTVEAGIAGVTPGGIFDLSGGSITVADAGKLDFATGQVTLTVSDNGAITAGTLTVDATTAATGLSTQKLNLAGGTVNVKNLKVGTVADSLSMTGGKLVVAESFQNGADAVDMTGGVLSVDKAQIYDASTGTLLKSGVNKIDVSGNGVVEVRNGGTMDKTEAQKFHDSLVGENGLWNGITVTGITATPEVELADGSKKDVVSATDAKFMSADQLAQTSVATNMLSQNAATLGLVAGQVALVANGQTLDGDVTLTAADSTIVGQGEGSSLVIGAGTHQTNVEVASGTSLNLGVASTQGGGTLNGGISNTSGNASTVNVANGAFAVNGDVNLTEGNGSGVLNLNQAANLHVAGNVNARQVNLADASLAADQVDAFDLALNDGSALTARNLTLQNDGAVGAGSIVQTDVLEAALGGALTVGNDQGKGVVVAGTAQLNGASVFLDPAWRNGSSITDASQMLVGGSQVDGLYTVGRNSHLTWGSTDQSWLTGAASRAGVAWGENATTAAVGVYSPQTLIGTNGGLTVNGALAALGGAGMQDHAVPGSAYFGGQSLLVVNSGNLNGQAAITSTTHGTARVADTAQLLLTDAVAGQTYTILSGFDTAASSIDAGGWSGGNLFQPSSYMLSLNLHDNLAVDGSVSVSADRNNASDVLPGISSGMAGLVDAVYAQGLNGVNVPNAGARFVSRATDSGFMPASESARALESAAQTALAGGAPSVAFDVVTAATGAVGERTSISVPSFSRQAGISAGSNGHSFGVWATPLFRSTEIDGQKAGAFKYGVDSDLWGGAIGADVTNGNFRLGVALNVGGGDAKSSGDLYKTKNDFDFWGATAYAGYRLDNLGVGSLGLSADLGYSAVSSDIKQNLNLNLGMGGQLQSKVDADVYSVGMKAEYVIPTAFMDVTPSVGVRYNAYRQGRYNVDGAYGTVFNMDKSEMDTWTFPIGVKFSRDFTTTGWSVRPELNLAFIPAAGDTELDSKARIPGLGIAPAALTGHVFDDWTGEAGVGLTVAKENISFGLNYDFQGSENRKSHSVFGTLRIAF